MMYTILGGCGQQARAIKHYLYMNTDSIIRTVDIVSSGRTYEEKEDGRLAHWKGSYENYFEECAETEPEENIIISCLPAEMNYDVALKCLEYGCNMIDLGGVTDVVIKQTHLDKRFREINRTLIPDCGLAPGLVSSVAGKFAGQFPGECLKVFCGGIPKYPELPLGYINVFHPEGVIKEYSGVATIIDMEEVVNVPTLSEKEDIFIPGLGVLEADYTSGGTSISPYNIELGYFEYKTLRYPGHFKYVKENILSQSNPAEILRKILVPVSKDNPDIIVFHIQYPDGEVTYFWEYDYGYDISAMAQATGYVVASVAAMIEEKELPAGVLAMDEVDFDEIKRRVKLMPNQMMENMGWSL